MARPKCAVTDKDRFPSRLEAQLALADIVSNSVHHRRQTNRELPDRTYLCEFCGSWHMTSKSRRTVSH